MCAGSFFIAVVSPFPSFVTTVCSYLSQSARTMCSGSLAPRRSPACNVGKPVAHLACPYIYGPLVHAGEQTRTARKLAEPWKTRSSWKAVLQRIPVVPAFPARCHRHGHERLVSSPGGREARAPDGGCLLKCYTGKASTAWHCQGAQ